MIGRLKRFKMKKAVRITQAFCLRGKVLVPISSPLLIVTDREEILDCISDINEEDDLESLITDT